VALVIGLAAWSEHRDNERERTDTAARRIAAVADSLRTTDPRTAMLLGVAAWRVSPPPESRRALLGALAQPEEDTFTADSAPGDGSRRFLTGSGRPRERRPRLPPRCQEPRGRQADRGAADL
jgi:hypothetical protein